MKILQLISLLAAAIIIIFNKWILDYIETKRKKEGKQFNRQQAFLVTMIAAIILIIKGML